MEYLFYIMRIKNNGENVDIRAANPMECEDTKVSITRLATDAIWLILSIIGGTY